MLGIRLKPLFFFSLLIFYIWDWIQNPFYGSTVKFLCLKKKERKKKEKKEKKFKLTLLERDYKVSNK